MVKNFKEAKNYVDKINKGLNENVFANKDCTDSLRIFAETKDEERFKIVVNFMRSSIMSQKSLKYYQKDPLALIESFCEVIDHGSKANFNMFQTYRGLKVKKLPLGKTQKFFQKLYGSHFFMKTK